MRVVGFHLTKLAGEKLAVKPSKKPSTNIEFNSLDKEKTELFKDDEVLKISFKYSVLYGEEEKDRDGSIEANGEIIITVTKEESKEIMKNWKKKQLTPALNITLFNLILKRCTPKAILLEDEVGLPIHTPMPRLQPKKENQ